MDWNWFYSSLSQSVAAIVGIFSAFIISKVIANQTEFVKKRAHMLELLSASSRYREAFDDRSIAWYCDRMLDRGLYLVDEQLNKGEAKSPEEYYSTIRFPRFVPRDNVLAALRKRINEFIPERSKNVGRMFTMSPEFYREQRQFENRLSERAKEEGKLIQDLIIEMGHHTRLANVHLSLVRDNPESSTVVAVSIINALFLFFVGVILPLSYLPWVNNDSVVQSFSTYVSSIFTLKGLILTLVSLVYLSISITFWIVNHKLKYPPSEIKKLEATTVLENYSNFLKIRKENRELDSAWKAEKDTAASNGS